LIDQIIINTNGYYTFKKVHPLILVYILPNIPSNMGTIISCDSTMTNIDDTSEKYSPLFSSPIFHCGCCNTETMADDLTGCISQQEVIMESHEMEARNAAVSYSRKLVFTNTSDDSEGGRTALDLNMVHPSSPPFLGTSYWISIGIDAGGGVLPLLNVSQNNHGMLGDDDDDDDISVESSAIHTSCITASTRDLTGTYSYPTSSCSCSSSQHQPSQSSPNFILQNTSCNVSTPCHTPQQQQQQPPLEKSSVSTDITVSCTSLIVPVKAETARRLFGNRDDLLYSQDNYQYRDPISISRDDDSLHDGDYDYNNILNVTTVACEKNSYSIPPSPDNKTSTIISPVCTNAIVSCCDRDCQDGSGTSLPRTPDSQLSSPYSPKSEGGSISSIILRNGILVKRSPSSSSSPNLTPITISPTSTTTSNTTNTTYSTNASFKLDILLSDTVDILDGVHGLDENGATRHVNTLPSFQEGNPIRLRVTEFYAGYSSDGLQQTTWGNGCDGSTTHPTYAGDSNNNNSNNNNNRNNNDSLNVSGISLLSTEEQQHFFSYDPYFSAGQYLIEQTDTGDGYGNKLRFLMGEQYMTLQDGDGIVWAVTRSRHTLCPSTVIYSPKERYPGQIPSSHRPTPQQRCGDYPNLDAGEDAGVELYPWALVKKEGTRMDDDVVIHLAAEVSRACSGGGFGGGMGGNRRKLIGGLFDSRVSFRSRHGFDAKEAHSYTTMCRVEVEEEEEQEGCVREGKNKEENQGREIPCCIILRDSINRDIADVTIAPGIDPLLIICYLAVHAKMDVEPKLCEQ